MTAHRGAFGRRLTVDDYHPLEVATGFLRGSESVPPPTAGPVGTPRAALEAAVREGLTRPPCVVSFSGGRDSSTVLAVAAHVARTEGLDPPIPVTLHFPGATGPDETSWQELVVRHLGLPHWQRVPLQDEVDIVGPYAQAVLRRHGLLFPVNTHFHVPILEHARGGSLLTGIGGDEVLSPARDRRANEVLAGLVRPQLRDVRRIASAYAPRRWRAARLRQRSGYRVPWLTPAAQIGVERLRAAAIAAEEVRWDRWITRSWWTSRVRVFGQDSIARLCDDVGARATHPLQHPGFLTAAAAARGRAGWHSRGAALRDLVGDLLPAALLDRSSKANFNEIFFGRHSRDLAQSWDGGAVDPRVVDPDALRAAWSEEWVDARSNWLLQAVWLSRQPRSGDGGQ